MANNWQIGMIAGLDGTQSRNQLNSDIKGLARNLDKLKLYTEIDKNQVTQLQHQLKNLQVQLNNVTVSDAVINGLVTRINDSLRNVNIGNINIGNVGNQLQQVSQQIGNAFSQGFSGQSANAIDRFAKSLGNVGKSSSEINSIVNTLKGLNVQIKNLKFSESTNGVMTVNVAGIDEFYNKVQITRTLVQDLETMLWSTNNSTTSIVSTNELDRINNAFNDYTQKLAQFKSTNTNILSGLTQPLADFETKLAGLKNGTTTIDAVKNAFKMLGTEASKITEHFTGQLSKTDAAIRKLAQGDEIMDKLKASFKGLNNAPKEIAKELTSVSKLLQNVKNIESKEGRTSNWSAAYRKWADEVDKLTARLSVLQKQQASMTTPQIFKTSELKSAGIPYMTKVSNTIEKQMVEIQRMANAKGWQKFEVKGVEEADGKIKALTLTVRDAEGALKEFVMQRAKLDTGKSTPNGLMQVGDIKILETASKEQARVIESARKEQEALIDAMARVREKAEQARIAEEKASNKRQQLAAANAVNKSLEEEYRQRQKNIELANKQAELDRKNALEFTKSASQRLSSAISKYSYGDTSDANAMMKQMNRGLSNFGDLSNVQGNIAQLSSTVDKIIADLKLSHKQSLQALNEEIRAEQTLQSQKDAFNKKNINAIDYEIQKREQEAKAFSSMLQAQMQEQQKMQSQVNKIQLSMSTGDYESKVDSLIGKTQQWVDANGNARISTNALQTAMNNLNVAYANITATGGNTIANQKALIEAERALDVEVKRVQSSVTSMNATMAKNTAVDSLRQNVQTFYDINTKSHRIYGVQLQSIMAQLASGTEVPIAKLRQLSQEFINIQNAARQTGRLGLSFFDTLKQGMQSFSYWTSSTFIVMRGIQEVRQVITTVKELDAAMMDLTMATGYSKSQVEGLMDTYYRLGERIGATAIDVAASADTWLRQGKSIAETNKLIEDSMILSKISGLSAEESTKYLTSAMKGYKVATEDVIGVVDKLSAVDMVSATDVGGLAEGMSEVAASAELAGVSIDRLLGYLAIVGETTQAGMSQTGTSFNAIFSRMGNIKLARLKDYQNNGEDLNIWGITA